MPLWLRNLIMLGVFAVWFVYIIVATGLAIFAHGDWPPLPIWGVPGVTYGILSGRTISVTKEGVSMKEEKGETE